MIGSMPQFAAGQPGQALLLPITQSGSILHPGTLQRAQVINSQAFTKNLQSQPQNVISMPTQLQPQSVAMATKLVGNMSGMTTLPANMTVTTGAHGNLGAVIPLASVSTLQTSSSGTYQQASAQNTLPLPQVLNVPRVQLPRSPLQHQGQIRLPDPRTLLLHHQQQQSFRSPLLRPNIIHAQQPPQLFRPVEHKRFPIPRSVSLEKKLLPVPQQSQVQLLHAGQSTGVGTVFLASPPTSLPEARLQLPVQFTPGNRVSVDEGPLNLDTKTASVSDQQLAAPTSAFTPVAPSSGEGARPMTVSTQPLGSGPVPTSASLKGPGSAAQVRLQSVAPMAPDGCGASKSDTKVQVVKQDTMLPVVEDAPQNTKICFTAG